ncbi:MAG: hypothetical protein LBR00_06135 [Clostridiales Family XIII bacterium]|nr:hypothetical protein [Clostridiales Family XIII bacterium]
MALTNGLDFTSAMTEIFLGGATSQIASLFFVIALGAIMGKLYNDSGAAMSIAVGLIHVLIGKREGNQKVLFSFITIMIVYLICMFGGLDAYILAFTCLPITVVIARNANIPRVFLPAMLLSGGAIMGSAGVPQINNIMMQAAFAQEGMPMSNTVGAIGWVGTAIALILQVIITYKLCLKAMAKGEVWDEGHFEQVGIVDRPRPHFVVSIIPLIVVFVLYAVLDLNIMYALGAGIIVSILLMFRFIPSREQGMPKAIDFGRGLVTTLNDGALNYPVALMQVITPGMLAAVIMATSVFGALVGGLASAPIHVVLFALITGYILVAVTASPPATMMIIAPIVVGVLTATGASPDVAGLAGRAATMGSTVFCLLPYDGVIVLIVALARVSFAKAYKIMFLGALIPCLIGSIIGGLMLMAAA